MYKVVMQRNDASTEVVEDKIVSVEEAEYAMAEAIILFGDKNNFFIEKEQG